MNFKNLFFAMPVLTLISCGGASDAGTGTDTTTTAAPAMIDSSIVTASNADGVKFFEDNPESVTRYFYASRIRGDQQWENVCHPPANRSPKLVEDLALHDQKKIIQYRHLSTDWVENICNVHMELIWHPQDDEVAAETIEYIAFLEKIDGLWWITGFSAAVPATAVPV
jgi:hypothetical protein